MNAAHPLTEVHGADRTPPEVSVVIPVYNEGDNLYQTLQALRDATDVTYEVIVVNDASTDSGCEFLRAQPSPFEKVVLVEMERRNEPMGIARSRRHGAAMTSGEVLGWLDAHMSFAPDWLDRMLAHVDSGSLLCAAFWNYELTWALCWGADFVWHSERNYAKNRLPGFALRHRTKFPGDGAVEVPVDIGACFLLPRAT